MDCVFCNIISGAIPAKKVYEDELLVAFHDVNPQTSVHVLAVPKEHIASAAVVGTSHKDLMGHLWTVIPVLAGQLGIADGFRVVTNSGESAGQTVPHLHFHLQSPK